MQLSSYFIITKYPFDQTAFYQNERLFHFKQTAFGKNKTAFHLSKA
jgi:hypothetical protein